MDSVTHTLIGLATYGAVKKTGLEPRLKKALVGAALMGSAVPDADVIINLTERGSEMHLLWHRGLSHSVFLAPVLAAIVYLVCVLIFKTKDRRIYYLALVNVLLHIASDAMNAWGTGLFEPLSSARVSLGILPLFDFVIFAIIVGAGSITMVIRKACSHSVWRLAWLGIAFYVSAQGTSGYMLVQGLEKDFDKVAISAQFMPMSYKFVGQKEEGFVVKYGGIFGAQTEAIELMQKPGLDLDALTSQNSGAQTLVRWAPFVLVEQDEHGFVISDPRFTISGESTLYKLLYSHARENLLTARVSSS